MNRTESSTVSSSHVLIQRCYSQRAWHVSVFLVHIVGSRTRIVSEPNTIVLNSQWSFLWNLSLIPRFYALYLVDSYNFPTCFLDFSSLFQEIPETGLCDLSVWSKDSHSVEFRNLVIFGWKLSSNDLVLVKSRHPWQLVVDVGCPWIYFSGCHFSEDQDIQSNSQSFALRMSLQVP